jgi:hypothetical protein
MITAKALPSPTGKNRELLFSHGGRIFKGVPFKSGQLALDASAESDMTKREYESSDEDPLSRLRVYLDNAGFAADPQVVALLDALERDRGSGAEDDEENEAGSGALKKALQGVEGLSDDDVSRVLKIVGGASQRRAKDSAMPSNGTKFTPAAKFTPAMDSASVDRLNKLVPGIARIVVVP